MEPAIVRALLSGGFFIQSPVLGSGLTRAKREGFVREFANSKAVVSYETVRHYLIPL